MIAGDAVVHPRKIHINMDDIEFGIIAQIVCHQQLVKHLRVAFKNERVNVVVSEGIDKIS